VKRIEFEGKTHEFPADFTDADISAALGGGPSPDTRSGVTRAYQAVAKPATDALSRVLGAGFRVPEIFRTGLTGAPTPSEDRSQPSGAAQTAAEILVPQTPLQAGATLGTGGAAIAARGLRPGLQALSRVLGGALGGEVGNQAEGGSTGLGAAVGGGGAAAGEGIGALTNRLRLALPGGKAAANRADAARIGQTVEDLVPELHSVRSPADFRAMTEGGGQAALGQAKEGTTRAVEGALGGRPIDVPALGPNPNMVTNSPTYSLRDANAGLTSIGEGAFNQNILDRTAKKAADRRLYGRTSREMSEGIESTAISEGPEAAGAFDATQGAYAQGAKLLEFFKKSGVVDNDGFMNAPKMQRMLNNPKNAAILKRAMGPEGFQKFSDAVNRGAPRGETDRMVPGMGTPGDAWSQIPRGLSGATAIPRALALTLFPNLGSKYVGQNPLAMPQMLRSILDLGAQRGVGRVAEEP
jgi:hypothetical protein